MSGQGEPWRKSRIEGVIITGTGKGQENINTVNEEVGTITGTEKSQESIDTATAGAVVIIVQERMEGVNIIHAGEIKNYNSTEGTVIRAGVMEVEEGDLRRGGQGANTKKKEISEQASKKEEPQVRV